MASTGPLVPPLTPEQARYMLDEYAVLVAQGCPVGTELGIDLQSYHIDELFRGIKMIPPGPHYVYTASQGAYGDTASRVGFMHFFKPREIVIRQWNDAAEELHERHRISDSDISGANADAVIAASEAAGKAKMEEKRIRENLLQLDRYLAPFDHATKSEWYLLTQFITASRLDRTLPTGGIIRAAPEHESCPDAERPRGTINNATTNNPLSNAPKDAIPSSNQSNGGGESIEEAQTRRRRLTNRMHQQPDASDMALLPELKVVASTAMRFTALPPRCPADATPAQVTASFMDCFAAVELLIETLDAGRQPLALIDECQIAFVCFATGGSIDALSHWRRQLHLLAHSERAVLKWPQLYAAYVSCLGEQLPYLPVEMQPVSEFNTVYKDCEQLVRNCGTAVAAETAAKLDGAAELGDALEMFVARARGELDWEFGGAEQGEEDPDDAPVVVETDDLETE